MFSSLIAFNRMLTICQHIFNTQFRHGQTTQQYFCAVAISFSEKRKRSSCPFVPKRSVKGKQGNCFDKDWADKKRGSSQKLWDTLQQLNPAAVVVPGNSVAIILWLYSQYSSVLIISTRKQFVLFPIQFITILLTQLLASGVSSTCFLPCLARSASRILRRNNFVPVTFKFVAFFAC